MAEDSLFKIVTEHAEANTGNKTPSPIDELC